MGLKTKWRGPSTAEETRAAYRKTLSKGLAAAVRERVSQKGMGANGALKGYSENPLTLRKGVKKRKTPARGWNSFHEGGYKQYREELGLKNDVFVFSNTGAAWRDWKGVDDGSGPIVFGFSDGLNNMAADAAVDRGRPDMFEPDDAMLDRAAEDALEAILTAVYGK